VVLPVPRFQTLAPGEQWSETQGLSISLSSCPSASFAILHQLTVEPGSRDHKSKREKIKSPSMSMGEESWGRRQDMVEKVDICHSSISHFLSSYSEPGSKPGIGRTVVKTDTAPLLGSLGSSQVRLQKCESLNYLKKWSLKRKETVVYFVLFCF
jgi:hypothetical protein